MTSGTPQLSLYNTLTRKKEPFVPIDAANVRMYACGPTVYDFAHIGNGRMAIVFDLLFRLLRQVYGPDHVTYVRNITDVDDKINARAARDFPGLDLNEAIRKVTEKTAAQYQSDVTALGCLEPTVQPRATDNIEGMQTLITALIARHHAYQANGEVLFEVGSMPDYGKLSGRNPEDNLAGARVAVDTHKKNPADFVLWKQSSDEEPGWASPWGRGRPGWHIECSAMSERYLGQLFDIHGGGLDLIFPHHENEIAQSRCAHGTHAMANVWMHNGFLQVEGEKMSKSLGNFFTIAQLLETTDFGGRKWPGEVLRLAMLMTHYREPIDFSLARLEQAYGMLDRWYKSLSEIGDFSNPSPHPQTVTFLADDLDTHWAINTLHFMHDQAMGKPKAGQIALVEPGADGFGVFMGSAWLLGLMQMHPDDWESAKRADLGVDLNAVTRAVSERLAAFANKDFATADRIRAELAEQGIALMDYKDPQTGERRTKWEIKR